MTWENDDDFNNIFDIFERMRDEIFRGFGFGTNITIAPRRNNTRVDNYNEPYIDNEYDEKTGVLILTIDMTRFIGDSITAELERDMLLISAISNDGEPFNKQYNVADFVQISHKEWHSKKNSDFVSYNNGILTIRIDIVKSIRSDIYG